MPLELFNDGKHVCLMYHDLVDEGHEAVQANQFLIIDNGKGAVVDPGGNMTYNGLYLGISKYFAPKKLDLILASHADPDIVASLSRWFLGSECKIMISKLWARFVPHFCNAVSASGRVLGIPDEGMRIPLGKSEIWALPAHFLHAEGNFQFYDPTSRILFSGDMGASIVPLETAGQPVTDFEKHLPFMDAFHRRYMVSNRVCRLWAKMVRQLDIERIVPQHGRPMYGRAVVGKFVDWIEQLPCGIDLMTEHHYRIP